MKIIFRKNLNQNDRPLVRRFFITCKHLNHCLNGQLSREHLMEVGVCLRLYIIRDALWNCCTHCSSILSLWRRWDMQLLHFLKKLVRNKLSGMDLKKLNNDMNFLPALIFCNISQENASYISMADRNTEVHNEPW